MLKNRSPQLWAVVQALFVAFLWSTSWVLIKTGLKEIPALPFAGLRYTLAFVCLLPFAVRPDQLSALRGLSPGMWLRLIGLSLLFYSVTQGAQFLSLAYLSAAMTSLLLSFTTIFRFSGHRAVGRAPLSYAVGGHRRVPVRRVGLLVSCAHPPGRVGWAGGGLCRRAGQCVFVDLGEM